MSRGHRFIIASFDGLRPDLISPQLTPHLWRMKAARVTLAKHRTIYPSETRSAFPSLVTGATADRHGMIGNKYLDRAVTPPRYIDTSDAVLLRRLDVESCGQLYSAPSLGEILAAKGRGPAGARTPRGWPEPSLVFDLSAVSDLGPLALLPAVLRESVKWVEMTIAACT
ncbi:hypothetical protein ABIF97_004267 [Bradyrhizobium japonicum]